MSTAEGIKRALDGDVDLAHLGIEHVLRDVEL
jgi:hypothetical protein